VEKHLSRFLEAQRVSDIEKMWDQIYLASGGELRVVLIAMLGGTYIYGGRGTILGSVLVAGHHRHRHDRRLGAEHKVDTVKVTGLDTPHRMRRFVQDGTMTAFQLWSPYNEGLLAACFAVGVKSGKIEDKPGTTFEVPGLGTVAVGANIAVDTQADLTTLDKSSIDQFHF